MRAVINDETLRAASGVAQVAVQRFSVRDERSARALETLYATYHTVARALKHHDAALYVAASEARRLLPDKPLARSFVYPRTPNDIATHIDYTPAALAGYFGFIVQHAESAAQECGIEALTIGERTYTLAKLVQRVSLVGLEEEQAAFSKYLRQLFLYDPQEMRNPDAGRFHKAVLLVGPPGTGKTSLIKHCKTEAEALQTLSGTPFRFESFDAANFSSYFGKSTRILKSKLQRVKDPSGIGLFVIEDADMVLQSRDEGNAYHGVLQVQQYLMNELSGLEPWYGNTLTILTTNKPLHLDHALADRMQTVLEINPFTQERTHEAYFALHAPQLTHAEQIRVAASSFAHGLNGRGLESIMTAARKSTTRIPSDEEIRAHKRTENAYGTITAELLETLIARQKT